MTNKVHQQLVSEPFRTVGAENSYDVFARINGGGNARRIRPEVLELIGDDVVIVPNAAGIVGGVRAWNLTRV